jgi:hypothetical protein
MERWRPLTVVMNAMNRALGLNDFYPFVLSEEARGKMAFVHETIRAQWTPLPTFGRTNFWRRQKASARPHQA